MIRYFERPTRPKRPIGVIPSTPEQHTPYTNEQLKAAFFKLYNEYRREGDCGECPIIEFGDGYCDALFEDGSGCDEKLCREEILKWYARNDND